MDLMNRVYKSYLDKFLIVFFDDILIYSKSKEDHEAHLKIVLELLKKETNGVYMNPSNIEVVKTWKVPKAPSEIRSRLGLTGKANVVADALSRKERVKPRRVRAMSMTIQSSVKDKISTSQGEASKVENAPAEMLRGLDQQMEKKEDGGMYFMDQIWVPLVGDVRKMIMDEAHTTNWGTHLPLPEFSYNNSYHSSIRCAPFEALYGRKCRSPVFWAEVEENLLISLKMVQETTDKVVLIKERFKVAKDRLKSYTDNR
nr:putative polyprotein, identical [Tanacetum cinerariifolium]